MEPLQTLDERQAEREREAKRLFEEQRRMRLLERIPRRFRGGLEQFRTLSDECRVAADDVGRWVDDFRAGETHRGFYISGPTGSGKSGLVYGAYQALLLNGRDARLWYLPDFFTDLRRAMHDPEDSVERIIDEATAADVLLLDDIGAELGSDWTVKTLEQVLDKRYREMRPVVLSSNLRGQELLKSIAGIDGQRIVSRLCEMCAGIRLKGRDLRNQPKRKEPEK